MDKLDEVDELDMESRFSHSSHGGSGCQEMKAGRRANRMLVPSAGQ
jgi:hypothetical protein